MITKSLKLEMHAAQSRKICYTSSAGDYSGNKVKKIFLVGLRLP